MASDDELVTDLPLSNHLIPSLQITQIDQANNVKVAFSCETIQVISTKEKVSEENSIAFPSSKNSMDTYKDMRCMLIQRYLNLQLPRVSWLKEWIIPLENHYVELIIHKHSGVETHAQPTSIPIDDIFSPIYGQVPYRILIEGGPGYGKTTLAWKLAFDWARNQKYMTHFSLVFVLELRYVLDKWEDALVEEGRLFQSTDEEIFSVINKSSENVLLIMDGYDELSEQGKKCLNPLLCSKVLPRATVVVTSRALNISVNDDRWMVRFTIKGIAKDKHRLFLEKYLPKEDLEKALTNVEVFLKERQVSEIFDCPLFLLLLTILLMEINVSECVLRNKTDLYRAIFNFMINRCLEKEGDFIEKIDLFRESSPDVSKWKSDFVNFGHLCLSSLMEDKLWFKEEEIEHSIVKKMGVIVKNFRTRQKTKQEFYEPLHKSLLEFSAAFYLVSLKDLKFDEFVKEIKRVRISKNVRKSLVMPFVAGLLRKDCCVIFEALSEYTHFEHSWFKDLIPILVECEITNGLLDVLIPYIPSIWYYPFCGNLHFSSTDIHYRILCMGIEKGLINFVVAELIVPIILPCDVTIPKLKLICFPRCSLHWHKFKGVRCNELILRATEDKKSIFWKDFISAVKIISAQNVSLEFINNNSHSLSSLPYVIHECTEHSTWNQVNELHLGRVELKETKTFIHLLFHFVIEKNVKRLTMKLFKDLQYRSRNFLQLLSKNTKRVFNLTDSFQHVLNPFCAILLNPLCCLTRLTLRFFFPIKRKQTIRLITCFGSNSSLDHLCLWNSAEKPLSIDLQLLFNHGNKSWIYLSLSKFILEPNKLYDTCRFRVRHLILSEMFDLIGTVSLLQPCIVESLTCQGHLFDQLLNPSHNWKGIADLRHLHFTDFGFELFTDFSLELWKRCEKLASVSIYAIPINSSEKTISSILKLLKMFDLNELKICNINQHFNFVQNLINFITVNSESILNQKKEQKTRFRGTSDELIQNDVILVRALNFDWRYELNDKFYVIYLNTLRLVNRLLRKKMILECHFSSQQSWDGEGNPIIWLLANAFPSEKGFRIQYTLDERTPKTKCLDIFHPTDGSKILFRKFTVDYPKSNV